MALRGSRPHFPFPGGWGWGKACPSSIAAEPAHPSGKVQQQTQNQKCESGHLCQRCLPRRPNQTKPGGEAPLSPEDPAPGSPGEKPPGLKGSQCQRVCAQTQRQTLVVIDPPLLGGSPGPQGRGGRATLLRKGASLLIAEKEACASICPPGGACTPAAPLTLKPGTAPSPTHTLIMHLPADPRPASHFLPPGYSATPPPPSPAGSSPSRSTSLLPTTTSPTPSLPPSASRASGAPGEPLILCLSPQDRSGS